MNEKTKIIIADDSGNFRDAATSFINKELSAEVIGTANDGDTLLKMKGIHLADIILMDINMPNLDGITTTKRINRKHPEIKIIAVTMHADKVFLDQMIFAGYKGCVLKKDFFDKIETAIQNVSNGQIYFSPEINTEKL